MLRAFHDIPVPADAAFLTLAPEESRHLVKVLRVKAGEPVCVFDGKGRLYFCRMHNADSRALTLTIEKRETVPEPRCKIALAQAMPKGSLTDDIVRQATEIGAACIYPLTSDRCEIKLDAERAEKKRERWRQIAVEACKQCGNPFVPEIAPVTSLREFLESRSREESSLWLTASLEAGTRFCHEIATAQTEPFPQEILWFVGPEGDFSPDEYSRMRAAGCLPARLGKNVLRAVTAAIYTLSAADQMRIFWNRF